MWTKVVRDSVTIVSLSAALFVANVTRATRISVQLTITNIAECRQQRQQQQQLATQGSCRCSRFKCIGVV